jgi:hypothetical protein
MDQHDVGVFVASQLEPELHRRAGCSRAVSCDHDLVHRGLLRVPVVRLTCERRRSGKKRRPGRERGRRDRIVQERADAPLDVLAFEDEDGDAAADEYVVPREPNRARVERRTRCDELARPLIGFWPKPRGDDYPFHRIRSFVPARLSASGRSPIAVADNYGEGRGRHDTEVEKKGRTGHCANRDLEPPGEVAELVASAVAI